MAFKYPAAPYNSFRGVGDSLQDGKVVKHSIDKTFDEPTYLSFRLRFSDENTSSTDTNFDLMPMPLFKNLNGSSDLNDDIRTRNFYSSHQYLRDSNELVRADMMLDFIEKWDDLQQRNQWYFQEISGLDSILNIKTDRGKRVQDSARLKLKMLEGLDWRITHLLNLYRKIAWDDVYQRWILPDMMRYFKLDIYITEFRSFHRPNISSKVAPGAGGESPLMLKLLESVTPTYVLELERCEFDINSFNTFPDTVSVNGGEMREISFDIKVGNFKERYINPIFNFFYHDTMMNGYDRSEDNEGVPAHLLSESSNVKASPNIGDYAKGDMLSEKEHESGTSFIQTAMPSNMTNSKIYEQNLGDVNPIEPNTWVSNTLTLGKSLLTNFVESKVDELKVQKIPGLNISFNEALAGIQSKNVFTLFGVARRALEETIKGTLPSQELESGLIDTQFRQLVEDIIQSTATSKEDIKLKEAANLILNEEGKWEAIKDLSKATDLISKELNEINTLMKIENPNTLRNMVNDEDGKENEIQNAIIFEGTPTSIATSGLGLDNKLKHANNLTLDQDGNWKKIKDLSIATDLVSTGIAEKNTPNDIENPTALRDITNVEKDGINSIEGGTLFKGTPISVATTNTIER